GLKKHDLFEGLDPSRVTFSADGRKIACPFGLRTCRVWDSVSGLELECYQSKNWIIDALVFTPDGKLFALGEDPDVSEPGQPKYVLLNVAENKIVKILALNGDEIFGVGRNTILTPGKKGVRIWDWASAQVIGERSDIPNRWKNEPFPHVEVSSDRRFLII